MMATLEALRDALATIEGVASCKIGTEANISPDDYPLIRIVPSRIIAGRPYHGRSAETFIYFGHDTSNSEGLELVYELSFALEAEILTVLRSLGHRYLETIADSDELPTYKMMAVRCDLIAPNTAPPAPAPAPSPAPPAPAPAPAPDPAP
jgi:hypothetical protein